jgi:hypothetical protein
MEGYWRQVFSQAWVETKRPLGFDKKTAATALLFLGGAVVAYFKSGVVAMTASLINGWWLGLPFILAGTVLFAWNFVEAQATVYSKLETTSNKTIRELQAEIEDFNAKFARPNYEAIKSMHEFRLYQAACFWCDLAAQSSLPTAEAEDWFQALKLALERGELEHVSKPWDDAQDAWHPNQLRVTGSTVVTRASLRAFAETQGRVPRFLQD